MKRPFLTPIYKTLAVLLMAVLVFSSASPIVFAQTATTTDTTSGSRTERERTSTTTEETTPTEENTEETPTTETTTTETEDTTTQEDTPTDETPDTTTTTTSTTTTEDTTTDTTTTGTESDSGGGATTSDPVPTVPTETQPTEEPEVTSSTSSSESAELDPSESDTDNTDFDDIHEGAPAPTGDDERPVIDVSATSTEALANDPVFAIETSNDGTGNKVGGTIFTGDARASADTKNTLNITRSNIDGLGETNGSIISSDVDNDAEVTTLADARSHSGENIAEGGEGTATIISGDAISTSEVINVVNTNFFNSDGLILFLNPFNGDGLDVRDFDLDYFFDEGPGVSPTQFGCTVLTCLNSSALSILNKNVADVDNTVYVHATTGENLATATSTGEAYIETGDAYAAANVLNLVNTNFINSSYLVLAFNNFGDLNDDIVLPGAGFFNRLLAEGAALPTLNSSSYVVNNNNDENFLGNTTARAETGGNVATTIGNSAGEIFTGNAHSSSNSYTAANQTRVGGASVLLSFRVEGDWSGNIRGLPDSLTWQRTDYGFEIYSTGVGGPPSTSDDLGIFNSSSFLATSTNIANLTTNVEVIATTGNNITSTQDGNGEIRTGDAFAAANVVNLVNTNIVGRNWVFATFNIFGDWSGDIAFGGFNPDLAITSSVDATGSVNPEDSVVYHINAVNNGDVTATNVVVSTTYDKNLISLTRAGITSSATSQGSDFNLGNLAPGESVQIDVPVRIQVRNLPADSTISIPISSTITSNERDQSDADNSSIATIRVSKPADVSSDDTSGDTGNSGDSGNGGGSGGSTDDTGTDAGSENPEDRGSSTGDDRRDDTPEDTAPPASDNAPSGGGGGGGGGAPAVFLASGSWMPDPEITITKTANVAQAMAPIIVDYEVIVTNAKAAGPAYESLLTDILLGPSGEEIYNRSWNLETLEPGDQIQLKYSVEFATSTKIGTFTNTAKVIGQRNNTDIARTRAMDPVSAVWGIEFIFNGLEFADSVDPTIEGEDVELLKASICKPLITQNMSLLLRNNPSEVTLLQEFLARDFEIYPRGLVTGYFGLLTHNAVKAFQNKYAEDVLHPLGLSYGTGYVGASTIKKINELACGGVAVAVATEEFQEQTTVAEYVTPYIPARIAVDPVRNTESAVTSAPEEGTDSKGSFTESVGSFFRGLW